MPENAAGSWERAAMPELVELEVFDALYAADSITRAAEDLHLSQSQLSRILRRLERKLGVSLFRRSTAGLRLTNEGELFRRSADVMRHSMVQQLRRFRNEVAGEAGDLRVSVLPSMAFEFLGGWADSFRRSHPHATVTATDDVSGNSLSQVLEGTADVAIAAGLIRTPDGLERKLFPELPDLRLTPLLSEHFVLVSPPGTAVPAGTGWREALDLVSVGYTERASVDRCLSIAAQVEGADYCPENRTNSPLTIAGMVEAGLGHSIVPESNLEIMRIRNLVTTRLEGYQRIVCIAFVPEGHTRLVQHFIEAISGT